MAHYDASWVFGHVPREGGPGTSHTGKTISLSWPGNVLVFPQMSCRRWLGWDVGGPFLVSAPCDQQDMDGSALLLRGS